MTALLQYFQGVSSIRAWKYRVPPKVKDATKNAASKTIIELWYMTFTIAM